MHSTLVGRKRELNFRPGGRFSFWEKKGDIKQKPCEKRGRIHLCLRTAFIRGRDGCELVQSAEIEKEGKRYGKNLKAADLDAFFANRVSPGGKILIGRRENEGGLLTRLHPAWGGGAPKHLYISGKKT